MKIKVVSLPHGIVLNKEGDIAVPKHIRPYTLTLLEPVDGIDKVVIQPETLGGVIKMADEASKEASPGTARHRDVVIENNVSRRCEPAFTRKQLDAMAGVDYDALVGVINSGIDPETRTTAFRVDPDAEVISEATMRLHMRDDRKTAEQRLNTTPEEEPVLYEANLCWLVTRFGEVDERSWSGRQQVSFLSFLNLSWQDFLALERNVFSRDYKPITDILEGRVEVDGKPVTFPDVLGEGDEAPRPKNGRRKSSAD